MVSNKTHTQNPNLSFLIIFPIWKCGGGWVFAAKRSEPMPWRIEATSVSPPILHPHYGPGCGICSSFWTSGLENLQQEAPSAPLRRGMGVSIALPLLHVCGFLFLCSPGSAGPESWLKASQRSLHRQQLPLRNGYLGSGLLGCKGYRLGEDP